MRSEQFSRNLGLSIPRTLSGLNAAEWELLCDGCGRCCLVKLQDADSGEIYYTNVACRLLDIDSCRCREYDRRFSRVRNCLALTPDSLPDMKWMPRSCAYRRIVEGRPLAWWHPLVSGDPNTVHEAGVSVRGKAVSESAVSAERLEDHIIDWPGFAGGGLKSER